MSNFLPRWPWIAGFGALSAVLVMFHRHLGLSLVLVVLILAILLLIALSLLLWRQLRLAAAAEEIEKTISTQADADIERSTPGQLAENQRLKEDLLAAIAQLKGSNKRGGADALAKMPWYMVLGPSGAGKSALIKRSGLEFPLREAQGDPRAVKGVGGTRSFSWWLAHEAVLLDMAGRTLATAAFDDNADWITFLQTLRKQRPGRPIQGAVVVVSIDQLADQPEAKVDSTARATRERLQELVQHLGVVFPVYVVFNRADRIAGFSEFFADLSPQDRHEPWGATLSMERARANPADQLFEEEFGVLQGALSERRLPRMAAMPDAASRARAFAFPLQLERVRGSLRRFLRVLFEPQAEVEAPLFRGFYFTSASEEGDPSDRVLQPAVRSLGLTIRAPETTAPRRGGSWYVRDLLTEVVFPDAGLATASRGSVGRLKRGEQIHVAAWALVFLLCVGLFSGLSCSNRSIVERARREALDVSTRVADENALVDNLRSLDRLRQAADELDRVHRDVPFGRRLGAWAGGVERDPVVRMWMRRTSRFVLKPAVQRMEAKLRERAEVTPATFLDDYYRFRAWRLLTDPHQIDPEDSLVLAREVTSALSDRLDQGGSDAAGRNEYPDLVRRQMEFLSRNPADLAAVIREDLGEQDRSLVSSFSRQLKDAWRPEAFYDEMAREANRRAKPLAVNDLIEPTALMSGAGQVSGAFTRDGWEREVRPSAAWYGRLIGRDRAIVEAFGGRAPELEHDLLSMYAHDVTSHWVGFLDSIAYAPQQTIDGVADQLARLAKGDSPLFKLLKGVREQTAPIAATGPPLDAIGQDFLVLTEFFAPPGSLGDRSKNLLSELWRRMPGQGGSPTSPDRAIGEQYRQLLSAAQVDLSKLGSAPALEKLQGLLHPPPDQTNGVYALATWLDGLEGRYGDTPSGAAVLRLLRGPLVSAAHGVQGAWEPRLKKAWQDNVVAPFQLHLGGKYPFAAGGPEASLDEVAACFGPQGYFWDFYRVYLPNYNEDGSPKSPDAPAVPPGILEFLRKAYVIRQAFFASAPKPALAFTVSTTPPQNDPSILVRWVAFDCGGETVTYTMGPPHDEPLHWPDANGSGSAEIRAQAAPPLDSGRKKNAAPETIGVEPLTGNGVWGLFRLLDRANSATTSGSTTSVTWTLTAANGAHIRTTWELEVATAQSPFGREFMRLVPQAAP